MAMWEITNDGNVTKLRIDGRYTFIDALFSYGLLVAIRTNEALFVVDDSPSVTTSKHINRFFHGKEVAATAKKVSLGTLQDVLTQYVREGTWPSKPVTDLSLLTS